MPKKLLPLPNYRQQGESDCLAACAYMMLAALDIKAPYQELLKVLDVAPWGTPAFDTAPQRVAQGDFELAWIAYDTYFAVIQRR